MPWPWGQANACVPGMYLKEGSQTGCCFRQNQEFAKEGSGCPLETGDEGSGLGPACPGPAPCIHLGQWENWDGAAPRFTVANVC